MPKLNVRKNTIKRPANLRENLINVYCRPI
jgi:hypothetical protein